jgi:hypothetical protein
LKHSSQTLDIGELMAFVTATAFVDRVLLKKDGAPWGIKTSETHYRKDGDDFVPAGRTYRTVRAGFGVQIDFTQFAEGDKIEFSGKEKTVSNEVDGKTYYDLVVDADSVSVVKAAERGSADLLAAVGAKEVFPNDPDAPF